MKTVLFTIIVFGFIASSSWGVENTPSINPVNQDQLIEQLLVVSGLKKSLQQLQSQVTPSFREGNSASDEAAKFQTEVVRLYSDSYPKEGFVNRVKEALNKNYDERRYSHLLQLLSTPLSKRMADLESTEPTPLDFQNYVSQVANHPLSPNRIQLIQRIDSATRSSALLTTITIASVESNAIAMSEDCVVKEAIIRQKIAKNRPEIEKATRSRSQVMLSFTYRDVSDADLSDYINVYEDPDSKWLQEKVQGAIEEQFKLGIKKVGYGMKQIVQSHKPKKTMFAPKCNGLDPLEVVASDNHPMPKPNYPTGGQDLRDCLNLEDSAKVIACTEKAHKAH